MLKLIIGNRAYSSWSLRGWLAVKQSGQPFEELVVPMFDDEWDKRARGRRVRAVARQGADPVGRRLRRLGQPGDHRLPRRQASAATASGRDDDAARGMARSMAAEMHSGFANLRRELPMNVRKHLSRPASSTDEVATDIVRILQLWAQARARFGGTGDFLFGDLCAADIMYAPVVTRFITYGVPVPRFAALYMKAVLSHPHVHEWIDKAQDEPWVIEQYESRSRA